mmetsp:Transcript_48345/g.90509  ORF Transcript_48345/g.90509 Transcript_48345/m.90509 type:complete len:437 (-) Transcript_48345:32-1342(-)
MLGLAFLASSLLLASAEKPRKLFEIGAGDKEVGLDPFYEGNMEPWGVVCVGYVKQGSGNHQLLQKLAANTKEDAMLWDLQLPIAAAIDWEEEETLQIVKRNYAAKLWEMLQQPPLDDEPVVFPKSKRWKEKEVRKWLMENAFPTINYRVPGYQGKKHPFPFDKYFGESNSGGVGLVVVKVKDLDDFGPQFRAVRYMRPHIEKLVGKIHFAVVEKSEKTLDMRKALKVGLNESLESELILFSNLEGYADRPVGNHFHGNPKKYRLTDLGEEPVNAFFEAYLAGKLPTYWASSDEGDRKAPREGQLVSWRFEDEVFQAPRSMRVLVAFFNDPSKGCEDCERGKEAWEAVQKEVRFSRRLREKFRLLSLDQSRNEHPEQLVPGRIAQPMVVNYPPGSASQRRKRRHLLHGLTRITKEGVLEVLSDLLEEEEEGEEDEEL